MRPRLRSYHWIVETLPAGRPRGAPSWLGGFVVHMNICTRSHSRFLDLINWYLLTGVYGFGKHIDGLVKDRSISIADALEVLQSRTKSSICNVSDWLRPCLVMNKQQAHVSEAPLPWQMRRYSDMKLNKWQESKVSHRCGNMIHVTVWCMGLLPDTQYCGWRMRRESRERFPRHWFQRKQLVSDPDLHQGTCVTHVPWCMSGSLSRGGGEVGKTFPAFPAHAQPAI